MVIVVGAGLAGMVAALSAREHGASVILLDRSSVGLGSNSALAGGVFTGPTPSYSAARYVEDTCEAGRWINRLSRVRAVAGAAEEVTAVLQSLTLPIERSRTQYAIRGTPVDAIPGLLMVKALAARVEQDRGIRTVRGAYVDEVIVKDGRAAGVRVLAGPDGTVDEIGGDAVILATGGAGALYRNNDNQKSILGQGYYLAAQAGVSLWDMEFVQFYPLVISGKGFPSMILYPPFPDGSRLIDEQGRDVLEGTGFAPLTEAIHEKRDEFSRFLVERSPEGPVYMDFSEVPDEEWLRYPLALLAKLHHGFQSRPVPVQPAAHFVMGGLRTEADEATAMPGLFACGELVWGLHGANRRGGNALTECVVSGMAAGRGAALRNGEGGKRRGGETEIGYRIPDTGYRGMGDWGTLREFGVRSEEGNGYGGKRRGGDERIGVWENGGKGKAGDRSQKTEDRRRGMEESEERPRCGLYDRFALSITPQGHGVAAPQAAPSVLRCARQGLKAAHEAKRSQMEFGVEAELKRLKAEVRETAWQCAGVARSSMGMAAGLETAERLWRRLRDVEPTTRKAIIDRCDVMSACFVLRAVLTASLARTESRGSFYRSDYPEEDDANWRRNSCLTYDRQTDTFAVTHHPAG